MKKFFSKAFYLLKRTVTEYSRDNINRLGAALAYYMVFSLPAIIIIMISTVGMFIGKATVESDVIEKLSEIFGRGIALQIKSAVESITHSGHNRNAALIGSIVLFVGASGVFNALQDALHTIFRVYNERRLSYLQLIINRIVSVIMVIGVSFMLMASLVLNAVIVSLNSFLKSSGMELKEHLDGGLSFLRPVVGFLTDHFFVWINYGSSFIVIALFFLFLYKFLPDAHIKWRYAWRGALAVSLLFSIGKFLIEFYLAHSNMASAYGAAGTMIAFLVWIYYSAQLVFLGAEFIKVLSLYEGVPITPRAFANRVIALPAIRRVMNRTMHLFDRKQKEDETNA